MIPCDENSFGATRFRFELPVAVFQKDLIEVLEELPDVKKVELLPYNGTTNGKVKVFYITFHYRKFVYPAERVIKGKLRRLLNGDSAT